MLFKNSVAATAAVIGTAFSCLSFGQMLPTDCSAAAAPKQPVEVSVAGTKFTPKVVRVSSMTSVGDDRVEVYRLSFKTDDEMSSPMEHEVDFMVLKGQRFDGKVFRLLPVHRDDAKQPGLGGGNREVQRWSFRDRPAKVNVSNLGPVASLRLEFAQRKGNAVSGSIYMCVAKGQTTFDGTQMKADSFAIGTFQAKIE